MGKQCFKCHKTKSISEFYKHPMMGDGYLGKCKTCTKRDTAERVEGLKTNPEWLAKERARCRLKQEKYRTLGVAAVSTYADTKRWRTKNRHKKRAQDKAGKAVKNGKLLKRESCERCGESKKRIVKHHPDYTKPLLVQWLCDKCHGIAHRL